jgi:hypothetical protein
MRLSPMKLSLLLTVTFCSSCATTTDDFRQVDPESIAVVIGYDITAKNSVHPALLNAMACR